VENGAKTAANIKTVKTTTRQMDFFMTAFLLSVLIGLVCRLSDFLRQ
jgi:hypothetical protein